LINLKEKYPENDLEEIFLKKVGGNNE